MTFILFTPLFGDDRFAVFFDDRFTAVLEAFAFFFAAFFFTTFFFAVFVRIFFFTSAPSFRNSSVCYRALREYPA